MQIDAEQFAALEADASTPVVMLNLVRYRPDGREAYLRYSRGFVPLLKAVGGTILWAGDVTGVALGDPNQRWDYAVLVQYPTRQAFVDTLSSDAYAAINADRVAGLEDHLILPVNESYSKFIGQP